jgi:tetratricopeptide (TPR) repeat protein
LKYYDEVLASKPDDYDVKYNKAVVLHSMQKYSDAIAMYNELLKEKDNKSVLNNLAAAYVAQGDEYLKSKNYSLATEMFEKAIENGTSDSYAYFGLAQAYRACSLNDKATEYFEKAISMAPDKAEYSKEFAEFISATNKSEVKISSDGASVTEVVLTMDSVNAGEADDAEQNKSLIAKGDENYNNKNFDLAIKNYQEALKIKPSDEVTLLKIGNIYKLQNNTKSAISFYKKSIVVNPNYADGWFNLGLVYANDRNNGKAKECFYRVISLNPNYGYAYYALAVAYEQDDNAKEAINNYKIFLTHNKDEALAKTVEEKIKQLEQ